MQGVSFSLHYMISSQLSASACIQRCCHHHYYTVYARQVKRIAGHLTSGYFAAASKSLHRRTLGSLETRCHRKFSKSPAETPLVDAPAALPVIATVLFPRPEWQGQNNPQQQQEAAVRLINRLRNRLNDA